MSAAHPLTPLPPVPLELASRGVGLRPEAVDDEDFLRRLYISVRWEELAGVPWPNEAKGAFLGEQFGLQSSYYRKHYPGAAWGIIMSDVEPVGRLYLHQGREDLRIIDITLLPEHRGRGIGGGFIRAVFTQAMRAGTGVSIHVEVFNHKARRLYDRLGFVPGDEAAGVYQRMDWIPPCLRREEQEGERGIPR